MKRTILCAAAALMMVAIIAGPAFAGGREVPPGSNAYGASLETWMTRWGGWAFGSETNPLMNNVCGEVVDGAFFLEVSVNPGTADVDCVIPRGVPVMGTPGGYIAWNEPADVMKKETEDSFSTINNPVATLDGRAISTDNTLRISDPFTIDLAPDSFIKVADPNVTGDTTQAVIGIWFLRLTPLTPGHHELYLADDVDGDTWALNFHITV